MTTAPGVDHQHGSPWIGAVLIDALARQGVADVVCSPGSRSAPLTLAAADHPDLRLHVRLDERTAAFLALGLARGSGRPAAVLCSSGTATANFHPAVLEADAAAVPLIVLTADRPAELRDVGANQTVTQTALFGGAVRYTHEIGHDDQAYLRSVMAQAVGRARGIGGPPGPVHVNVPLREPLVGADLDNDQQIMQNKQTHAHPVLTHTSVLGLSSGVDTHQLLSGMRRGLIVAGEGTFEPQVEQALAAAGRMGLPVVAEPTSGLRWGRPALRCGHWLAASPHFSDQFRPDVVIQVGRPVLSRPVTALIAAADRVITLDPLGRWWDPQRRSDQMVNLTLSELLAGLTTGVHDQMDEGWLDTWLKADRVAAAVVDAELDSAAQPSELGTTRDLVRALPDDALLVVASSLAVRHLNETQPPRPRLRVLGNRGASGIDGFVSSAVGAALGHAGRTAALAGDLSIIHDLTGLVIGPDEPRPSLPLVVLNNDGGGIFDLMPYSGSVDPSTFRRVFATPHGLPLHGLALTMGHAYTDVDDLAELPRVIEDAWSVSGITLIEVRSDTATETARYHRILEAVDRALRDGFGGGAT